MIFLLSLYRIDEPQQLPFRFCLLCRADQLVLLVNRKRRKANERVRVLRERHRQSERKFVIVKNVLSIYRVHAFPSFRNKNPRRYFFRRGLCIFKVKNESSEIRFYEFSHTVTEPFVNAVVHVMDELILRVVKLVCSACDLNLRVYIVYAGLAV